MRRFFSSLPSFRLRPALRLPAAIALVIAAAIGAAGAAGPAAFGSLALWLGMPSAAAALLADPAARGVALYRAGNYAEADRAFQEAGRAATYNRGLSLAATGNYALSVAYFDAVLFVDPADQDARYNRELVAKLVPDVVGESNDIDGVAANVEAAESDAVATQRDLLQGLTLSEQVSVMDPRVDKAIAASEGWLTTLPDEPGLYLKRRIRAEYERRQDLGLANPPEDTAW